jgi:hypothetical protein
MGGRLSAARVGLLLLILAIPTACAAPKPPTVPVTMYVRSNLPNQIWFEVQPIPDPPVALGFGPERGVGCFDVPVGSHIVALDRAPQVAGATSLGEVLSVPGPPRDRRVFWVDVANDARITVGAGVPAWWGDPQAC